MKINFENNDYTLKVSWYKNDKRICVYLENAEETLNITKSKLTEPEITTVLPSTALVLDELCQVSKDADRKHQRHRHPERA